MATQKLFAITGDTHLDQFAWSKHPTLRGDSQESFRQIVNYCLRNEIPLLLLGDIFDRVRPDPESVACYVDCVEQMRQAHLPVYYIQGDHDRSPDVPWMGVTDWPRHLHQSRVELSGMRIYGLDYSSDMRTLLADVPPGHILATHCGWSEMRGVGTTEASFTDVRNARVILTGDYHVTGQWHGTNADGASVEVFSPGSTNMRKINESPAKSFGVYERNGMEYSIRNEMLYTRPMEALTLDTEEALDGLVAWLADPDAQPYAAPRPDTPAALRKGILRICYAEGIPEAYARIKSAVGDRYHVFYEPQRDVEIVQITDTDGEGDTAAFGCLTEALPQLAPVTTQQYEDTYRLLVAQNVKQELRDMFDTFEAEFDEEENDADGNANADGGS